MVRFPDRLDRGDYMAFMPEDVLNKNFTATQFRRGYDEQEVDDFLDEIVVELRRLSADNDDLGVQLKACQESKGLPVGGAAVTAATSANVARSEGTVQDTKKDGATEAAALAAGIASVVADPSAASALGDAGREHVVQNWTWERSGARLEEILISATGR